LGIHYDFNGLVVDHGLLIARRLRSSEAGARRDAHGRCESRKQPTASEVVKHTKSLELALYGKT
jgi:hypothetical protein